MQKNIMYQYTSISRPLNPLVYPTHRLLVALVPLAGVILGAYTLLTGGEFGEAVIKGFYAGASATLAWVLAREIDPDNPYSAFVALILASIGALFATPNIWALGGAVVLIRIVNRIVGFPAKIADSVMAIALGLLTMLITGAWIFGAVVALAFLLDATLPEPNPLQWSFLLAILLIMIPTWRYLDVSFVQHPQTLLPIALGIGTVFAGHIATLPKIKCQCDMTSSPPHLRRVQAGMGLMLVLVILFALIDGDGGFLAMMPLWATFVGVMVYRGI